MQILLDELIVKYKPLTPTGRLASYIPELTKADSRALGIAVADASGVKAHAGDMRVRFTLQSVSSCSPLPLRCWITVLRPCLAASAWSLPATRLTR
ncbi:MAG: Glutaminase 2 [Firmicutes bacterium]|nr:Glutaminase 2 [Bacillota bacterium]